MKLQRFFTEAFLLCKTIVVNVLIVIVLIPVAFFMILVFAMLMSLYLWWWTIGTPIIIKQNGKVIGRIRWFKYYPTEK